MLETKSTYSFNTVPDDLFRVQHHTLANGLQLFLSVNPNEPRVFTHIVVRAGSKQDPPETTGLAHYMEHMLFKGTSRIGALDWEKEKALLEQISDLYEQHRHATNASERERIYAEIDRISGEAAKLVAPNEYDKLCSTIGAKDTNAYTWMEQTVYVNDIPANELERWMQLEAERFRMMALRLFHTELETVYEEFNINQDNDNRKVYNALVEALFPAHPYGTQTTLGRAEHLRNPSQVNIQRYFQTYYVPNNMAIMLAGDFDPVAAVQWAEQYFGAYEAQPIPSFTFIDQPPLNGPLRREILGLESPKITIGWRLEGAASPHTLTATIVANLLFNQQAGLLDLHLNQEQKVLESFAFHNVFEDYGMLILGAKPRQDQSLEEVEALLLGEIAKLRQGDFEDWLIEAVINDLKLGEIKATESNKARVAALTSSFILGIPWAEYTHRIRHMARITKAEVVAFAEQFLSEDYVVINKLQGPDPNVIKVEKPPIHAVTINREATSSYAQHFMAQPSPKLDPVFVDFDQHIQTGTLGSGIPFDYVRNPNNQLFRLDYIFEMGKNSDRELAIAMTYLPYLGTHRFTRAQLQQEFFRLGLSFEVNNDDERTYLTLSGLEENLEPGLALVEHLLHHLEPDAAALENVVADILIRRENFKQDRSYILRNALGNYARYGTDSPFTYRLTADELVALDPQQLVNKLRELPQFEHRVYYYGQLAAPTVVTLLDQYHAVPAERRSTIPNRTFTQLPITTSQVYFLDFPIVQTDVMLLSKGTPNFALEEYLMGELYNQYFGYGLSSIVFQEIRESKALAYSTYAYFSSPRRSDQAHYLQAYVGTQPDKLADALPAFNQILNHMPVVDSQIEQARQSILKVVETERILPDRIYWTARQNRLLGYHRDLRQDLYQLMEQITPLDLVEFQLEKIKNRAYTYLVMGSREQVDLAYLENYGPVRELSLTEIFGY